MPSTGHVSSTNRPAGAGAYAPTELAATNTGTCVRATASTTRRVPTTLVAHIVRGWRDGWISHRQVDDGIGTVDESVQVVDGHVGLDPLHARA